MLATASGQRLPVRGGGWQRAGAGGQGAHHSGMRGCWTAAAAAPRSCWNASWAAAKQAGCTAQASIKPSPSAIRQAEEHTTRNWNCLGGSKFPWGPKSNCKGNDSFLGGATPHSRKHIFLGGLSKPPRDMGISLTVSNHLQGNDSFSWQLFSTAKENTHFLGSHSKPSSKFLEGY